MTVFWILFGLFAVYIICTAISEQRVIIVREEPPPDRTPLWEIERQLAEEAWPPPNVPPNEASWVWQKPKRRFPRKGCATRHDPPPLA